VSDEIITTSTCPTCFDLIDIESMHEEGRLLIVMCVNGHRWHVKGFSTKIGRAPVYELHSEAPAAP
jgi:hypothetical protein